LQAGKFAVPSTRILGDEEVKKNKNEVEQAKRREKEIETDPGLVERGRRWVVRS